MTDRVAIAWMFRALEGTAGPFTGSLADLLYHDGNNARHVVHPDGGFIKLVSGPRIAEARNQIIDQFALQFPNADWLLFLDSDMTFEPDMLDRMLEVADPKECPILGALAFIAGGDQGDCGPSIFEEVLYPDGQVFVNRVKDYPLDTLCKVGATGAAGLLVHRTVLAAMMRPWPDGYGTLKDGETPNPYPWFAEGLVNPDGKPLGEDVAFCRRAGMLGIPTHVHTGIKMGHIKVYQLDEAYFQARKADREFQEAQHGDRASRRRAARERARMSA